MTEEKGIAGPHLSAAFLCEKILIERDGVPSYVRVVDRFNIPVLPKLPPGIPAPPIPPPILQATLVVAIKAGDLKAAKYTLTIRLQKPDGHYEPDNDHQVFFNGSEDAGVLTGIPVVLPAPPEGLYWFDVLFEGALLTRVPMRILHQQVQIQFQPTQG